MGSYRERSLRVFPAGSNGEFNIPEAQALVIQRGEGASLWDCDGKHYYDFSMGWGSVLPGHAHPDIVNAVQHQTERGSNFSYINEPELCLAEEIIRLSPCCEQIRFCASGTEATMYMQRLARAFTGQPRILKFEGAYHGANEMGITSLFPDSPPPFPSPDRPSGVSQTVLRDILVAPFNDIETTTRIMETHRHELAGVIVEPFHRCIPPREDFLQSLRAFTKTHNLLLLFDEVVTGFRLAYRGAQKYYGVQADLVAYGKALGGGYPIGAFGGREEIMDFVREDRMNTGQPYVWSASTLGGNPISCAAANAALQIYRQENTYAWLHNQGYYLRNQMKHILEEKDIMGQIIGDGPLAGMVFSHEPVFDYRSTKKGDSALGGNIMLGLLKRGIFLNPMGTKLYLSLAHTTDVCDEFLNRFADTVGECI